MALAETDIAPTPTEALPLDSIICGDALDVLRGLPDNSIDAIITDPPAGISFMGKSWDSDKGGRDAWIAWLTEVMREALRVVKPGGHALVWSLPRTSHWTAMALEDAGWEIRDRIAAINGQGFPKSLDVSKAIDKAAGANRGVVSEWRTGFSGTLGGKVAYSGIRHEDVRRVTNPATDAAQQWDGWGTALKPAVEDWWLCRKPLSESNIAANVLRWGTGALNIEASRIGSRADTPQYRPASPSGIGHGKNTYGTRDGQEATYTAGRWPANLLLSHSLWCDESSCALDCPVRALDAQSGERKSGGGNKGNKNTFSTWGRGGTFTHAYEADTGGASRYFQTFKYTAKASRSERNRGCSDIAPSSKNHGAWPGDPDESTIRTRLHGSRVAANSHPTVKPLALMSWLIGLITPPGGLVLDPFAGSGSTLVAAKAGGWHYIGIEKEAEYVTIAHARVQAS